MAEYALEAHHVRLLTLACEAYDSAQDAREILQREGKIYIDRFDQPKPRPEVAIQRDSAIGFARMLRELDLDNAAPKRLAIIKSALRRAPYGPADVRR